MAGVIVQYPNMRPAKCFSCGNGYDTNRKYVDTKRDILRYGRVYYCSLCIGEIAGLLGYLHESKVADIVRESEEREGRIKELEDENVSLRQSFDRLDFIDRSNSDDVLLEKLAGYFEKSVASIRSELGSGEQNNISDIASRNRQTSESESRIDESDAGEGSTDVLADAEFTFPTTAS